MVLIQTTELNCVTGHRYQTSLLKHLSSSMESSLASSAATASAPLLLLSKSFRKTSSPILRKSPLFALLCTASRPPLLAFCLRSGHHKSVHTSIPFASLRYLSAAVPVARSPFACISNSAAFYGGGGSTGGVGGSGGGEGGGSEGGDFKKSGDISEDGRDDSALSPDVIILDVGGMTCGGCAASVKRILESQSQVSSASVNLTTETAVVWPVSEAKDVPNWRKQLGEMLAQHLTNCGFNSNHRGQGVKEGDTEV